MEAMFAVQFLFSRSLQYLFICSGIIKGPQPFFSHTLIRIR